MVRGSSRRGSRFVVDLGDVKLPDIMEKSVEADIQAVVLRALAETDYNGNRQIQQHNITQLPEDIQEYFPEGTLGIIIDGRVGTVPTNQLEVQDHTRIMKAVMDHPYEIIHHMDSRARSANPNGRDVLDAALRVDSIDSNTKDRIKLVLEGLGQIEEAERIQSSSMREDREDLERQLNSMPDVSAQVRFLRESASNRRYRQNREFNDGLEIAAQILEDGINSIYSPSQQLYRSLGGGPSAQRIDDHIGDIAAYDGVGGTYGAAVGSVVPGVGTSAGGVAGATGASTGAIAGKVWNWLTE